LFLWRGDDPVGSGRLVVPASREHRMQATSGSGGPNNMPEA
jgi:hypothetical protein